MKSIKRRGTFLAVMLGLLPATSPAADSSPQADKKPNIVFILVDDAGIGDFSAYGCSYGTTPNIDRLAAEGMKFTHAYSGSAVCAPSRCVLMTGQHTGHVLRRANQSKDGLLSLPAGQATVARLLHDAGYATGGFGKWGLGNPNTTGVAEKQGFDVFFGYYDQKHAHDYYTDYLVRNSTNVPYQQSGKHTWEDYSHTHIANETLKFIEENKDRPFFCYAAWTPPHDEWVIPDNAPFSEKPWSEEMRNYAAMVALVDKDVGRLMQKLKDLGIDDNTLVIFSSDNGANDECVESLKSTGGLRGFKRMLYEGGIRAPFIARMPGKIAPGTTSDVLTTSVDFMPTAADLAGVSQPSGIDGISILPTLLGKKQAKQHDSLYFEIYEPYFQQSLRMGDWKGYRLGTKAPLELYDLKADPAEKQDIAAAHPEIVKKIEAIMLAEHTPSPHYDAPEQSEKGKKKIEKKGKKSSLPELLNEENPKP
ncbi:MAG: arylsulfatase [Akkermansiaceae bacterium]|nr:arylsulfatase [Akkermansiaceae bacterium]